MAMAKTVTCGDRYRLPHGMPIANSDQIIDSGETIIDS
jgi:hypothetical protein